MSDDTMRIHRALARAGVASRRKAEELVAEGRVRINGEVAKTGQSVDPSCDVITVDGEQLAKPQKPTWLVLHKPAGVLTSRPDGTDRRTHRRRRNSGQRGNWPDLRSLRRSWRWNEERRDRAGASCRRGGFRFRRTRFGRAQGDDGRLWRNRTPSN